MTTITKDKLPLYHRLKGRYRDRLLKCDVNIPSAVKKIRLVWCSSLLWVSMSTLILLSFVVFDGGPHQIQNHAQRRQQQTGAGLSNPIDTTSGAYPKRRQSPYVSTLTPWATSSPNSLFNDSHKLTLQREYEQDSFTEHHFTLPTVEERVRYYMGEYWYGDEDDYEFYEDFTNLNLYGKNPELEAFLEQKKEKMNSWCRRNAPPSPDLEYFLSRSTDDSEETNSNSATEMPPAATPPRRRRKLLWDVWYYLWCGDQTAALPRGEVDDDLTRFIPYLNVDDPFAMQNWKQHFHHNTDPEFVRNGLYDTPFLFDASNLHELLSRVEFGVQGYPRSDDEEKLDEAKKWFDFYQPVLPALVGGAGFTAYVREAFLMLRVMDDRKLRVKMGPSNEANAMLMFFGVETKTFEALRIPILSQCRALNATYPGILAPFDLDRKIGDREMGLDDALLTFRDTEPNETITSVMFRVIGRLEKVQIEHECPNRTIWEDKLSTVAWRGEIAGNRQDVVDMYQNHSKEDFDLAFGEFNTTDLLPYKYLLSLEGDGVSSDLKWMMYAPDSVLFMPKPAYTSWLMEDKLIPWYHYIPLQANVSDLPEKLKWAREHDDICRRIAQQSTQFIYDLILSDQAQEEEAQILQQMAERYHGKYGRMLAEYIDKDPKPKRAPIHPMIETNPFNYTFEFPSVKERVRYYMGRWFCDDPQNPPYVDMSLLTSTPHYSIHDLARAEEWRENYHGRKGYHIGEEFVPLVDVPFLFNGTSLEQFVSLPEERQEKAGVFSVYANDAHERVFKAGPPGMKAIMSFGDMNLDIDVPAMVKSRRAKGGKGNIIAPFNMKRHYIFTLDKVDNTFPKLAWEDKRDSVIWRGATSGSRRYNTVKTLSKYSKQDIDVGFVEMVDVDLTDPEVLQMKGRDLSVSEMLAHKYFLSLEGNDVATGLKWMLYAPDAVVFMQRPTQVSWAMEDKLVPFVHYIPLQRDDASDLPEMLAWARENEEICKEISRHATKYIEDLYASEKAQKDNEMILQHMTQRYYETYQLLLEQYGDSASREKGSSMFAFSEDFKTDLKSYVTNVRAKIIEAQEKPLTEIKRNFVPTEEEFARQILRDAATPEEERDENEEANLVWLMSFPLSGASNILRGIANVTGHATASNYATTNIPVIEHSSAGPFVTKQGLNLALPRYVLTNTHCDDGGDNYFPYVPPGKDSMMDIVRFAKYCASYPPDLPPWQNLTTFPAQDLGYYFAPWNVNQSNVAMLTYPVKYVKKAIHVIRHPFDNLIGQYLLNNYRVNNTIQEPPQYQYHCIHVQDRIEREQFPWLEGNSLVDKVPCFSSILKYVNWHNRAFAVSRLMRIPTLVVRYEDYARKKFGGDDAQSQILEFLEQPLRYPENEPKYYKDLKYFREHFPEDQRTQMPAFIETMNNVDHWYEFEEPNPYKTLLYQQNSFFFFQTKAQRNATREYIKSIACPELWDHIKKYDFDLD